MTLFRNKDLIYKFAPVNEYTYRNLILKRLWFNPPNLMNDQLEGLIKIRNLDFKPSKNSINNFIEKNNFNKEKVYEIIKNDGFIDFYMTYWFHYEMKKYAISCFSTRNDESLMWAHYTDKHKGICLVYDKNILLKHLQISNSDIEVETIKYGVKPIITLAEKFNNITYQTDIPLISTKNKNWKYEKEVRFLFNSHKTFTGKAFTIGATPLKAIIYGYQISEDDKNAISEILSKDFEYSNVKEYNVEINYKNGNIEIMMD